MKAKAHPLYSVWRTMKARCQNPSSPDYQNYGGRGITVCEAWCNDFWSFVRDVGEKPSPKHSLDRKNNDGNYEPNNMRWATPIQQNSNRRDNVLITAFGSTLTIPQWAKVVKLKKGTIWRRLFVANWTPEKALLTPIQLLRRKT